MSSRIYSASEDGVVVRDSDQSRPLYGTASENDTQSSYAWGRESPEGRKLALALLSDALEDEKRAAELADRFNARVISILPPRWTMTRERVRSYADLMS